MALDLLKKDFGGICEDMAAKLPRLSMTVTLYPAARQAFDRIAKDRGMNKTRMAERIMLWFAEQKPEVQDGILYPKPPAALPAGQPPAVGTLINADKPTPRPQAAQEPRAKTSRSGAAKHR